MRKKTVFVNTLKCLVFLLLLTGVLLGINKVMIPKYILKNSTWPTTSTYTHFYEMEENTVDVLFLGSSVAVNAFNPQEIYNAYGIRSYNLSSEQQSIFLSYYWLKEAMRTQSPKAVVLDTKFVYDLHAESPINTTEGIIRKCLDPMRLSKVKAEAVHELCALDESQNELSFYLTNIRFHARWSGMTEQDFVKKEYTGSELKGFGPVAKYGADTYRTFELTDPDAEFEPQKVCGEYLKRMADHCRENGIELILVSLPGNEMNNGVCNYLTSFAEENGVDYYNFCETKQYEALGAELPRENTVNHQNLWGSIRTSSYIGKLLKEKYGVEAVSDGQYEETKEYYEHIKDVCELPNITDFAAYLKAVNNEHYTVFMVIKDEGTKGLSDAAIKALAALGLKTELAGKTKYSFAAVIDEKKCIAEKCSAEQIRFSGSIRDHNVMYTMKSVGSAAGTAGCSIVIEGSELAKNGRGINIVVYDNTLMKVVDNVRFDTYLPAMTAYR